MSRPHRRHAPSFGFPHVFAVPCAPTSDAPSPVRIYQATLLQESPGPYSDSPPVYLIAPYRIFHPWSPDVSAFRATLSHPEDGWTVMFVADRDITASSHAHRRNRDGMEPIVSTWEYPSHGSLTSPTREVFFHGHWTATGRVVLSMYCATAIPILEFSGSFRSAWPRHPAPPVELPEDSATPEVFRAWQRRWEAPAWEEDIAREFAEAEAGAAAADVPLLMPSMDDDDDRRPHWPRASAPAPLRTAAAPPPLPASWEGRPVTSARPTPTPTPPAPVAIPAFVREAVLRDAVARSTLCPITMEPLTDPTRVTLTACFHVFDAAALTAWRASGENKCPTCRATL